MLDPKFNQKYSAAYAKLGDIGEKIAKNLREGKDYSPKQNALWEQGLKMWQLLKLLNRYVDRSTTPPTLYIINETQANRLMKCLEQISEISVFPIFPTLVNNQQPAVINQGKDGDDGLNGTDADIIVEAAPGETQLHVAEQVILGIKHYILSILQFKAPVVSLSIAAPTTYEKGINVSKTLVIASTKGSSPITALHLNIPALDSVLQGLIDLPTLNGVTQPVTYNVATGTVTDTTTYTATVTDTAGTASNSKTISFFYPYLYGVGNDTSTSYAAFSKVVAGKANGFFVFNATNQYLKIGYPSSYGTLSRIKDENGFVVTNEFNTILVDITSVGLDVNWTVQYRFYISKDKTSVSSQPFSIEF